MKKLLLIIALVAACLTIKAQDVPSNISSALNKKYPQAEESKQVDWEREGINYSAKFSEGDKVYEVQLDNNGHWLSTDVDKIPADELPAKVQTGLDKSEYNNWQVGNILSSQTPKETTYKIGVRKGVKMRELYFDDQGKLIRDKSKI